MLQKIRSLLLSCALLALCIMLLAACGTQNDQTASGGASGNTPTTPPTVGSGTTATATSVSFTGQNCGSVEILPSGALSTKTPAAQVGTCFWQAYNNQCQPAMIIYSVAGIDTLAKHTFTILKNQGACQITDEVQHRIMPRPATVTSYTCTTATKSETMLSFESCGQDGTITVPLVGK